MKNVFVLFTLMFHTSLLFSQIDSVIFLNVVEIKSIKTNSNLLAISASHIDSTHLIALPSLSINESIASLAGVFTQSPNNFAQDSRISSRGFGARAAFGIRGIKILLDEIPESTPDGQAQLDDIDFSNLHRVSIIRGPQAGIYGNSTGGVIQLYSQEPGVGPLISIGSILGTNGLSRHRIGSNIKYKKFSASAIYSHINYRGYREWSDYENRILSANFKVEINNRHRFKISIGALDNPTSNDAGALTLEEANTNPKAARDRNIQYKAGERIQQVKAGIIYHLSTSSKKDWLTIRNYFVHRAFDNFLPFAAGGAVTINRNLNGTSIDVHERFRLGKMNLHVDAGIEYEKQIDRRKQHENIEGEKGDLNFDQDEIFQNYSAYVLANTALQTNISLFTTLRYDRILTKAKDYFMQNGDQSGNIFNAALNYSMGINFKLRPPLHLNLLYSTGFENPTLIELSNNPSGLGGLNDALKPMRSQNFEVILNYNLPKNLIAKISIYQINSTDEITSFEIVGQSGRSFYQNAGKTIRRGIEFEVNCRLSSRISMNGNLTFSKFSYRDFLAFDENSMPGIPIQQAYVGLDLKILPNLLVMVEGRHVGKYFLDDANVNETQSYFECNLRSSYRLQLRRTGIHMSAGLNNLLNAFYYSNLRINAAAGRYYEAAPTRHGFVGLEVSF